MFYRERYFNGEYEEVWNEMGQMKGKIRQEYIYSDALTVARETMRRVRKNIEMLIERLVQIGFIFGYDHRIQPSVGRVHPAEDRKTYLENFLWARQQPPVFLSATQKEEEKAEQGNILDENFFIDAFNGADELVQKNNFVLSNKEGEALTMAFHIDEIERLVGFVPISLRAWYEEVGGVNFYGYHKEWEELFWSSHSNQRMKSASPSLLFFWDPLMVHPLDNVLMARFRRDYEVGSPFFFEFAPDRSFKDNLSGAGSPYSATLPDANIDFQLGDGQGTFVQYLRRAILIWAGFPGMADGFRMPHKELEFLTHDLIPF